MKPIRRGLFALVMVCAAFGQAPARPEFEVASIRPSGPTPPERLSIGLHIDGAQVTCNYLSLKDYLGMAYQLKLYQIAGPDFIATTRFDIAAKLPSGSQRDEVRQMLQALFEDRFQMKTHREKKEFAVYGLVIGKGGLKMKESAPDPETDASGPADPGKNSVNVTASGGRGGTMVNLGKGSYFSFANNRIEGKKLTMVQFADLLSRFVDRPVVEMTQLTGTYDLALDFSPEDFRNMMIRSAIAAGVVLPPEAMQLLAGASDEGLFNALQSLGLKLESRKAPIEVMVIDKMEKMPTEN